MSEKLVAIAARFPESEAAQIDDWRRAKRKIPNMSEAMRTLVERGLRLSAPESLSKEEAT